MIHLNSAVQNRRSPRAFSDKIVTKEMIESLFEAARWAPSAMNEQPWLYFYAGRENQESFRKILGVLTGINPQWAKDAQYLVVSVARKFYDNNERPNASAFHDVGAANISIAIQAAEMGFQVRQMGGFDKDKAAQLLQIDRAKYEPMTVIAVGFQGEAKQLPEDLKLRELQPRLRKEVNEFTHELTD